LRRGHGGADDAGLRVLADDTGDRRVHRAWRLLRARGRLCDVGAQGAQRFLAWARARMERGVNSGMLTVSLDNDFATPC
jgi:hypothetical protein